MGREEQVHDAKCTRPSLPVEGLAPRLIPTVVQAVTKALKDQLKEHCPPPPTDDNRETTNLGEGMSAQACKLLLIKVIALLFSKRLLFNVVKSQHLEH